MIAADPQSKRLPSFLMGCDVHALQHAVRTLYEDKGLPPNLAGTVGDIDRWACEILGRSVDGDAHHEFHDLLDNFLTLYHVEEIPANYLEIFGQLRDAVEGRLAEVEVACRGVVEGDPVLAAWWRVGHELWGLITNLWAGVVTLPRRAEDPCLLPRELMEPIRAAARLLPLDDRMIVEEALPKLQPWDEGDLVVELREAMDQIRIQLGGDSASSVGLDESRDEGNDAAAQSSCADLLDDGEINPQGDWSVVVTGHGTYYLGDAARQCFARMYEARKRGYDLSAEQITRGIDVEDRRIDHIFSGCKAWAKNNTKLVGSSAKKKGYYQINL
jgi:hypothetical protein